jgi:hypothetical protein
MKLAGTIIDLPTLEQEARAAGVAVPNGLGTTGLDAEGRPDELVTWDDDGQTVDVPPEMAPVVAAHDPTTHARTGTFEQDEDAERLRIVNERARTDPAFAALAALALKGQPS